MGCDVRLEVVLREVLGGPHNFMKCVVCCSLWMGVLSRFARSLASTRWGEFFGVYVGVDVSSRSPGSSQGVDGYYKCYGTKVYGSSYRIDFVSYRPMRVCSFLFML